MKYKVPKELTTLAGQIIVINEPFDINREPKGNVDMIDINKLKSWWGNREIDVVVLVQDEPHYVDLCLQSVKKTIPSWLNNYINIVVIDCCSEYFTKDYLDKLYDDDVIYRLVTIGDWTRLGGVKVASDVSKAEWIIYLDVKTIVTLGWLESILYAIQQDDVVMVVPWSSKRIPLFSGSNYLSMSEKMRLTSRFDNHEITFPGLFCLAIKRDVINEVGGWDMNLLPGDSEIADLYMRIKSHNKKLKAVRTDAYIWDESECLYEVGKWIQKPAGYRRFLSKYGRDNIIDLYKSRVGRDKPDNVILSLREHKERKPKVVFIMLEAPICGMVLAVIHICNQLIEYGWDATFACTKLESPHRNMLPMRFEPYIFQDEYEMRRVLRVKQKKGDFVIATMWHTASIVSEICKDKQGMPIYFIQDDERKFKFPSGVSYASSIDIERSYTLIDEKIINSDWVCVELNKLGHKTHKIGIGVDTLMFHPEQKQGERLRIMAHSRPTTPRRGWPFVASVINKLAGQSKYFEFATYDEEPEGLQILNHGHFGKLSPQQLAREMSYSHIFIEGSEFQGWGMQALEAMASGNVLVCTDNYGIHNFGTSGHDCVIVPHGDVDRTVAILMRLIEKQNERELLSKNARNTSLRFDWKIIGKEWDRYLKNVSKKNI